jgi:hypothetical protein
MSYVFTHVYTDCYIFGWVAVAVLRTPWDTKPVLGRRRHAVVHRLHQQFRQADDLELVFEIAGLAAVFEHGRTHRTGDDELLDGSAGVLDGLAEAFLAWLHFLFNFGPDAATTTEGVAGCRRTNEFYPRRSKLIRTGAERS